MLSGDKIYLVEIWIAAQTKFRPPDPFEIIALNHGYDLSYLTSSRWLKRWAALMLAQFYSGNMGDKEIRHIVADEIGYLKYCPSCGSELDIVMDMDVDHDRECPDCESTYIQHEIEFLVETEEMQNRQELMEQEDTTEVLRKDSIGAFEDIDVMRPEVDLRMERLSDRSVYVAGYNGGDDDEIDYRYWFTVTDDGGLRIDREFIRDRDD
jgi:Zn-finger nucleic acid-binding protein